MCSADGDVEQAALVAERDLARLADPVLTDPEVGGPRPGRGCGLDLGAEHRRQRASSWRTGAVALGVTAIYFLAAVEVSSLLMQRLPRRLWRGIHLSSYVAFWPATFLLVTAGTDASHPASKVATAVVIATVVFLTLVRALNGRGGGCRQRPARPGAASRAAPRAA